jgi:hypothetical protein
MASLSVVEEEQVEVAQQLKTISTSSSGSVGDGIMGATPAPTSTLLAGASPVHSGQRPPQVISTTPPPRTVASDGNQGDGDHIDGRRV